jgi:hypothetical protein
MLNYKHKHYGLFRLNWIFKITKQKNFDVTRTVRSKIFMFFLPYFYLFFQLSHAFEKRAQHSL